MMVRHRQHETPRKKQIRRLNASTGSQRDSKHDGQGTAPEVRLSKEPLISRLAKPSIEQWLHLKGTNGRSTHEREQEPHLDGSYWGHKSRLACMFSACEIDEKVGGAQGRARCSSLSYHSCVTELCIIIAGIPPFDMLE